MKLWDVSTKQETHQVAMALTVAEAWELRDCLNQMLGLERSGEPPSEWPVAVLDEKGWHVHTHSSDYQLEVQVMPDLDHPTGG